MITGFRRYQLGSGGTLKGMYGAEWETRELIAECKKDGGNTTQKYKQQLAALHLENDVACSCGIYVARQDYIEGYNQQPVLAAITGWGAFVEYENGWRIQYARIEHLWVESSFNADVEALEKKYSLAIEARNNVASWVSAPQYQPNYNVAPKQCSKCSKTHDLSPWTPKGRKPMLVCEMETSHVANALKYLQHLASINMKAPWHQKWIQIFSDSLIDRAPRKNAEGKTVVTW